MTGGIPYTNFALNVTFDYPAQWEYAPTTAEFNQRQDRFTGKDGFFTLFTETPGAVSLDEEAERYRSDKTYGTSATVQSLTMQGRDARLVLPSSDQPADAHGAAALIIQPPDSHAYLVLEADGQHIRVIMQTLRFLVAPITEENATWTTVTDAVGQSVSPVLRPGAPPPGFHQVEMQSAGQGTFEVVYFGAGKRLQIGVAPYQPPPDPGGTRQQVTVRGQPATLQVNDPKNDGRIWLWWEEPGHWQPSGETGTKETAFYLIYAEGLTADEVQRIAASLTRIGG